MRITATTTLALLLACAVALLGRPAAAFDSEAIRCIVCKKAIQHVWHTGIALREHCRSEDPAEAIKDPRCSHSGIDHPHVHDLVDNLCDELPKTHQSLVHSDFDLVLHDDPQHEEGILKAIKQACKEWVHDEHSVEHIALVVYANLEALKTTDDIMATLVREWCANPCSANPKKRKRDFHDDL